MSAIDMDQADSSKPIVKAPAQTPGKQVVKKPSSVSIEQKGYTLNVLEALRKKMKLADRKPGIAITDEAKDGSSINIDMKTALFEYMKEMWIGYMKDLDDVINVNPVAKAQAGTMENGKADVEYTLEVTFKAADSDAITVKIKFYPTKCRIQIQHMGGPPKPKECFGGLHSPKFFGTKYIIPWAKKVLEDNPTIDDIVLPRLRAELRRLDEKIKATGKKNKVKNIGTGQAGCSARKCRFQNTVVLSNTSAYGICGKCGYYEHFTCAKTKDDEKEDILAGKQMFYCSNCLFKFPSEIAYESNAGEPTNNPIIVQAIVHEPPENRHDNEDDDISHSCSPDETETEDLRIHKESNHGTSSNEHQESYQCELCDYKTKNEIDVKKHMDLKHGRYQCANCSNTFWGKDGLQNHTRDEHVVISIKCKVCDFTSDTVASLEEHKKEKHYYKCEQCKWAVKSKTEIMKHMEQVHGVGVKDSENQEENLHEKTTDGDKYMSADQNGHESERYR